MLNIYIDNYIHTYIYINIKKTSTHTRTHTHTHTHTHTLTHTHTHTQTLTTLGNQRPAIHEIARNPIILKTSGQSYKGEELTVLRASLTRDLSRMISPTAAFCLSTRQPFSTVSTACTQWGKQTYTHWGRQIHKHTHNEADRHAPTQWGRQTHKHTHNKADRHAPTQWGRHTNIHTMRPTNIRGTHTMRQTHNHAQIRQTHGSISRIRKNHSGPSKYSRNEEYALWKRLTFEAGRAAVMSTP